MSNEPTPAPSSSTASLDLRRMMQEDSGFPVIKYDMQFKRFIHVRNRTVQFPDGKLVDWDVVTCKHIHSPNFCVVFVYFTKTKTTTLLLEYMQGLNSIRYGMISGAYELNKHKSMLECAQQELSEEGHLTGGTWVSLLPESHKGIMEVKWCQNRFAPFLVIDPEQDPMPRPRDEEEIIEVVPNVTLKQLDEIILEGNLALTAVQTSLMARSWLKKNNYL